MKLAFLIAIALWFLLAVWGVCASFVASGFWRDIGFYLALEIAFIMTAWFYWSLATGRQKSYPATDTSERILGLLAFPVIIFLFGYVAVVDGIGDLANRLTGQDELIAVRLTKEGYSQAEECHDAVSGVPAGASMQETFCLPHYVYASLPQTFDAQLGTRHSRFGYRPYRIVDYRK